MENQQTESRFAELAMELFGAQAASKFLDQVWADASEQTKTELADAVVNAVTSQIKENDFKWTVRNVVQTEAARMTEEIVQEEYAVAFGKRLREEIEKRLEEDSAKAVRDVIKGITDSVLKDFRDRLEKRVRGY